MDKCAIEHKCSMCNARAAHKVEESLPDGEFRHQFTNYLCCEHFGLVFGIGARFYCQHDHDFIAMLRATKTNIDTKNV